MCRSVAVRDGRLSQRLCRAFRERLRSPLYFSRKVVQESAARSIRVVNSGGSNLGSEKKIMEYQEMEREIRGRMSRLYQTVDG